jgi:hypothetical protein
MKNIDVMMVAGILENGDRDRFVIVHETAEPTAFPSHTWMVAFKGGRAGMPREVDGAVPRNADILECTTTNDRRHGRSIQSSPFGGKSGRRKWPTASIFHRVPVFTPAGFVDCCDGGRRHSEC